MIASHEAVVTSRFDALHERFHRVVPEDDARLVGIIESLGALDASRVLDLGCGKGRFARALCGRGAQVVGLDRSRAMLAHATGTGLDCVHGSARRLPFDSATFDGVVAIEVFEHLAKAMIDQVCSEVRRVLRPGGMLSFVEHGRAPEPGVARWQDRLDPIWCRVAGGCHLNRQIDSLIGSAGFRFDELRTWRVPGPRTHTFLYEGRAR